MIAGDGYCCECAALSFRRSLRGDFKERFMFFTVQATGLCMPFCPESLFPQATRCPGSQRSLSLRGQNRYLLFVPLAIHKYTVFIEHGQPVTVNLHELLDSFALFIVKYSLCSRFC